MNVRFHPEAEAELLQAVEYYENQQTGLGANVVEAVAAATELIARHPRAWPVLEGEVRRCLVRRFPFAVLYAEVPDALVVVAVMSLHRAPGYWRDRRAT
jgi:plasmid stabilization system protein ParE